MSWIASILVALLTGGLSLCLAGLVAVGCIEWYHISGFEGKSGYFMVAIALLGGIAGCALGFAISRAFGPASWVTFLKGLGISWGVVVLISGSAAGIAWLLADIWPKIDGQYLELEVEIKLPAGETNQPTQLPGKPSFTLGSVVRHVQRKSTEGELKLASSRLENGRWIIPASADVFTMRGLRSISARIGDKTLGAFIIPLPARPGPRFLTWSEWGPRPRSGNPPWPETNPSYRFRVHRIAPAPPPPDPEEVEAQNFAALKPDAPLADWLSFLRPEVPEERTKAIMSVIEKRPAELAECLRSTNATTREAAFTAVRQLKAITPEIRDAVIAEGKDITELLRRFNTMQSDDPKLWSTQMELRSRFADWKRAWWIVHQTFGLDGKPPVQEIHDLAVVRAKDTTMVEIVVNAKAILNALNPITQQNQ